VVKIFVGTALYIYIYIYIYIYLLGLVTSCIGTDVIEGNI